MNGATLVARSIRYLLFHILDHRAVAIMMAAVTLIFVGFWFVRGGQVTLRPRSAPKAIAAGLTSGVTTMVAHSGGPPLAMYLLPLGLSKELYAGTTSLFFTVANATKLVPWLLLVQPTVRIWELMAISLLAIPKQQTVSSSGRYILFTNRCGSFDLKLS